MLLLDTETYSETPIRDGTHKYAVDAEVMLVTYAFDDGPELIWERVRNQPMPSALRAALDDPSVPVMMLNSAFDRTVLRTNGIADIHPSRIIDVMVQAYTHGLPGAMDKLCVIFGLTGGQVKLKTGKTLIHLFCKPVKGKRVLWSDNLPKWKEFCDYAKRDITAMRILHAKLPTWNYRIGSTEHALWVHDQAINDRGFLIDTELAEAAMLAAGDEKVDLANQVQIATFEQVQSATQRDQLLQYIAKEYGVTLPDMGADTLQRRVDDPDLPVELRELLALRIASSRNSSAKYKTALKAVNFDGRLRGAMQFCGAFTSGRWSHRNFQPGNLMRPTMKMSEIAQAIIAIKANCATLCYDNLAEVLGNCVRGVIIAPPGCKLVVADLKSIEGRGLAWLADEEPITQFYRDFDAGLVNYDSYQLAYSSCFGVDPWRVTKAERQMGKPIELAFGYGGGVAAFLTFAMTYHIDLATAAAMIWEIGDQARLRECRDKYEWAKKNGYHAGMSRDMYAAFEYVKQMWREARPLTVAFWAAMAEGFKLATLYPGKQFTAGPMIFRRDGHWLRMRLPSDRCLVFLQPKVEGNDLSYMSHDRYTRKWSRQGTHGGKLAGIATQAFARDILGAAIPEIEADGFDIVLTVHDEVVAEAGMDRTVEELCAHLTRARPWAPGLPLAADGFESDRYRKDG